MLKKMTILVIASAAIAAFVAPATASAHWTHKKVKIAANVNPHVLKEGTYEFGNEALGGANCHQTTITSQLIGGTTKSHMKSITFHNPATQCTVKGLIAALCGESSLTSGELTGEPTETITGPKTVDIEGIVLHTTFGECLSLTLSGDLTAEVDNGEEISNVTLEGTLDTGGFGEVQVNGNMIVTPLGTYGIHYDL